MAEKSVSSDMNGKSTSTVPVEFSETVKRDRCITIHSHCADRDFDDIIYTYIYLCTYIYIEYHASTNTSRFVGRWLLEIEVKGEQKRQLYLSHSRLPKIPSSALKFSLTGCRPQIERDEDCIICMIRTRLPFLPRFSSRPQFEPSRSSTCTCTGSWYHILNPHLIRGDGHGFAQIHLLPLLTTASF